MMKGGKSEGGEHNFEVRCQYPQAQSGRASEGFN